MLIITFEVVAMVVIPSVFTISIISISPFDLKFQLMIQLIGLKFKDNHRIIDNLPLCGNCLL